MGAYIDADVAQALVNYVERRPDDHRTWGNTSASDVRGFIEMSEKPTRFSRGM